MTQGRRRGCGGEAPVRRCGHVATLAREALLTAPSAARNRNAIATQRAILDAARAHFAAYSYDEVSLRNIASQAGVDAAMESRYFGTKEGLFESCLESCDRGDDLMQGDRAEFGRSLARRIVLEPPGPGLEGLLIILRSLGSSKASAALKRSSKVEYYEPMGAWLGGDADARVRSRLLLGLIMGMAAGRELDDTYGLAEAEHGSLCDRMAALCDAVLAGRA